MQTENQAPVVIADLSPVEALHALAKGLDADQRFIKSTRPLLRVASQKATALILATAKRFPSLEAFIAADNSARDDAKQTAKAMPGNAGLTDKQALAFVDSSYLTGCNQIRTAAGALGWEALQQAASIGAFYRAYSIKHGKKAKAPAVPNAASQPAPETMPEQAPEGPVEKAIHDLYDLVQGMDESVALAIVQQALDAAMGAAMKQAG